MKKQVAVIGLGRFGRSMVKELTRIGHDVMAIDIDPQRINEVTDEVVHAVQADAMDEQVLRSIGIRNFDIVIVSIGHNIQSNILTTIILKEMGVERVIAKAQNSLHGKVLEKLGIDQVIYPERDMAIKLTLSLSFKNILDHIDLSPEYSIMEMVAPIAFVGKTLASLGVRNKWGVTILAIRRGEEIIVSPNAAQVINAGDILVALGKSKNLGKICDM
ncbi:MAG: TrkA family potassium uptake protein [Bacillota bacterium]